MHQNFRVVLERSIVDSVVFCCVRGMDFSKLFDCLSYKLITIFLSHLFVVVNDTNFANYTDGGTIFDNVIMSLQESAKRIFQWFSENQVQGSTNKCYLIMRTDKQLQILTGNSSIKRGSCEKFLGVKIDAKLHFDDYAKTIHSKASNMLRASARATAYLAGNYMFKVNNRNTRKRCLYC